MQSEVGFRRLVNFSDAVVAIAITLLILPLVDRASSIGATGIGSFLNDNETKLLAFLLSFVVIGRFWWGQHQVFERVKSYNSLLVWGMFVWLLSIVFLPFPTELISSAQGGARAATYAIYIGTLLLAPSRCWSNSRPSCTGPNSRRTSTGAARPPMVPSSSPCSWRLRWSLRCSYPPSGSGPFCC
jgi:uncharacterized membrane protein